METNQSTILWTLPDWAADLIFETIEMDSNSSAFDPALRQRLRSALGEIEIKESQAPPPQKDSPIMETKTAGDETTPGPNAAEPIEELTEGARRVLRAQINANPLERGDLESRHGQVWNPVELAAEFEVLDFQAPFVVVRRKSDQRLGSLFFQHHPRFYFWFKEDQ